jgi:predicted nucleotidyltransferase
MTIQSSAQIGNVIRNAVVFNVKNWVGGMMNSDSLIQSVQDFFAVLEQRKIDYVLVGGIAILHYVEGRNTQDLDLLMAVSSLEKLPELKISSQDMYFVQANYNELQVDILLTQNPLFKKVHSEYSKVQRFLDRNIPLATVEGLLLLKLYALPSMYRQSNFARVGIYENDIATLLHYYQPDIPLLLEELSKYVNQTDFEEIEGVVSDIQNRIKRFKNDSRDGKE